MWHLGPFGHASLAQEAEVIGVDQVIDGDALRSKGIMRLGDILRHVGAARILTVDGYSHRISLNGLGSFHEPEPTVYVDGHPVDLSLFGGADLNLLGIPIEAVDRVEIVAKPALIYGSFAGRGAIHIHTHPEVEGLRAEAAVAARNEVGDPGPWAEVDDEPNTDTQGPDFRLLVEAGGPTAGARFQGVRQRHYLTKPALMDRLRGLQDSGSAPMMEMTAPGITGSVGNASVGGNLIALGVTGRYYPFLPYASREVSANYRAANVSAVARHEILGGVALRHRLTASAVRADQPDDSEVPFGWERESITFNTAFGRSLTRRVVVLGATARFDRARSSGEADRFIGSLYAAIAGRISEAVQYQGGGVLSSDWSSSALKAYGGVTIQPNDRHRGDVYLTIAEELPHEQNFTDAWSRRGIGLPEWPTQTRRPDDNVSIRATGDAEWSYTPNSRHSVAGGIGLRVSADTYAYRRVIQPVGDTYRTASLAYDYAEGTNATVWMEYAARLFPGRQRIFVHHGSTLTGDELFREIRRAVPDSRIGLSVSLPIAPDFEVEAVATHQSSARWPEFEGVGGLTDDAEAATLVDLAVYKRLFAGHVHVRLVLANLLRDEVRYHPMGDTFDLTGRIDVRVDFGTRRRR